MTTEQLVAWSKLRGRPIHVVLDDPHDEAMWILTALQLFDGDGPATASPTSDVEIQQPMSQIDGTTR